MANKGKFGALAEFRQQQPENAEQPPAAAKGRGRPAGKRSNPDYEPTTVLLRKLTKKAAVRMLEDTDAGLDLSELIEELLTERISRRT